MAPPAASSSAPVMPLPAGNRWRRSPPGCDVRRSEREGLAVHADGLAGRGGGRAGDTGRNGVRAVARGDDGSGDVVGVVVDGGAVVERANEDAQRLALRQD